jgi:hypothetical protein
LLSLLAPDQSVNFDQEFALWSANPAHLAVSEHPVGKDLNYSLGGASSKKTEQPLANMASQGLDATLVAGMFLQVILEAEHLPGNILERTSFVKQAVKNFLVHRLAGQITLSQFFRLVQIIEHEVTYYFHRLQGEWLSPPPKSSYHQTPPVLKSSYKVVSPERVRIHDLRMALGGLSLPHQANRKLSLEGLLHFLVESEGRWFRLLDFESQFRLNKKTAWTYLTLLLNHDILKHNGGKANKVRYALSSKFVASGK